MLFCVASHAILTHRIFHTEGRMGIMSTPEEDVLFVIQRSSDNALLYSRSEIAVPSTTTWGAYFPPPEGYGLVVLREQDLFNIGFCDYETQCAHLPNIVAKLTNEHYPEGVLSLLLLSIEDDDFLGEDEEHKTVH